MKVKISELSGPALDWAIAKVEGHHPFLEVDGKWRCEIGEDGAHDIGAPGIYGYSPSTDWSHGGPLIERFDVYFDRYMLDQPGFVVARIGADYLYGSNYFNSPSSPNRLIAAMRAIALFKLGEEIEVPEGLLS